MDKKTILVVDDAPENIQLLSGILNTEYKVKAATSGEKALSISAKMPPPDLILLDIEMPDMDGYETLQRLKSSADTNMIPVIFVTGNISNQDLEKGMEMGAADYLKKPIDPDKILKSVSRHIG